MKRDRTQYEAQHADGKKHEGGLGEKGGPVNKKRAVETTMSDGVDEHGTCKRSRQTRSFDSMGRMLECCVCLEDHATLCRLNECSHALCIWCHRTMRRRVGSMERIRCPLCRKDQKVSGLVIDPSAQQLERFLQEGVSGRTLPPLEWLQSVARISKDDALSNAVANALDEFCGLLPAVDLAFCFRATAIAPSVREFRTSVSLSNNPFGFAFVHERHLGVLRLPQRIDEALVATARAVGIPVEGSRRCLDVHGNASILIKGLHPTLTRLEADDGETMNLLQYHIHVSPSAEDALGSWTDFTAFWGKSLDATQYRVLALATASLIHGRRNGVKRLDLLFQQCIRSSPPHRIEANASACTFDERKTDLVGRLIDICNDLCCPAIRLVDIDRSAHVLSRKVKRERRMRVSEAYDFMQPMDHGDFYDVLSIAVRFHHIKREGGNLFFVY